MEAGPLGEAAHNVTPLFRWPFAATTGHRRPIRVRGRGTAGSQVLDNRGPERGLTGEALRYVVSGIGLAALYSAVYWTLAARFGVPVLIANTVAFAVNLIAGWTLHSRWTFAGRRTNGPAPAAYAGYFAINAASYGLNSLWVWTIVDHLHGSVALSIIPVVTVTPVLTFLLNRAWIFRARL